MKYMLLMVFIRAVGTHSKYQLGIFNKYPQYVFIEK